MNFKSNLFFSPLEQFEISSYNIFFNYITTFPLEIYETFYMFSLDEHFSIYTIFDLIFIFFIIKGFEFFLKNHSFIFLYAFILILLTCLNINSFIEYVILETVINPRAHLKSKTLENIIIFGNWYYTQAASFFFRNRELEITYIFKYLDLLVKTLYTPLADNHKLNIWKAGIGYFITSSLIPNLILNAEMLISYTWFLIFIFRLTITTSFYSGFNLNFLDAYINALTIVDLGENIINIKEFLKNKNSFNQMKQTIYVDFYQNFLFEYKYIIESIKDLFFEQKRTYNVFTGFEIWATFLIILVAVYCTIPVNFEVININSQILNKLFKEESINLYHQTVSPCFLKRCGEEISSPDGLVDFVNTNVSFNIQNHIYDTIAQFSAKIIHLLFSLERITILTDPSRPDMMACYFLGDKNFSKLKMNDFYIVERLLNYLHTTTDIDKNYYLTIQDKFYYVTINTSFINIYSILFCFIFIYIIIYLIFNKNLSINSNSLIPNIYQVFGENLYKISLNLFYSVLGKNITHPEFFIKINTIFIFLIISNVQGMIPYISTLTSALTNTFFIALALFISILITLFDKKGLNYFLNLFMPSGCPIFLVLLLIPIEFISYSFRVVSLSVRLFANMMAGHTLLKVIVGFSWVIVFLENMFIINIFPIIILFILTLLEFGVALIQAYIFTILSCIYLRDIFQGH